MVLKLGDNQVQISIHGYSEKKALLSLMQTSHYQVQFKLLLEDSSVWYSPLLEENVSYYLNESLSILCDPNNENELSLLNEGTGMILYFKFTKSQPVVELPNAPLCVEDRVTKLEQGFLRLQQDYFNLQESYGEMRNYCNGLQNQIQLLNKNRNLVIGCQVEHVKKVHYVLTHGIKPSTIINLEPEMGIIQIQKNNKLVEVNQRFVILKWQEEIEFNSIDINFTPSGLTNTFDIYISDNASTFTLLTSLKSLMGKFEMLDHCVRTRCMKIVGGTFISFSLYKIDKN